MKKNYKKPEVVKIKIDNPLLQTISGERSQSSIKPGAGGTVLSREARLSTFEDEEY